MLGPAGYKFYRYFFPILFFLWLTYETSNLRNYWIDLRQIFRTGRTTEGLNNSRIYFAIAKKTLPLQPILEAKSARQADLHVSRFVELAFLNELEYRNAGQRVKSATYWHTSYTNLVRFGRVTLEYKTRFYSRCLSTLVLM